MKLCIKNARHLEAPVDLLIEDGKILTMTPAGHCPPPEGCEIFEAQGFTLMPSLTDAHTHLREPGYEYKEDIASGLEFMGVKMDAEANNTRGKEAVISAADSKVKVLLIPTNEELMIAMDTAAIVKG